MSRTLDDSIVPINALPVKIPHVPGGKTTPLSSQDNAKDGQPATEDEIRDFLHVVDDIPARVWLATLVGVAERFTWYGNTGPLRMSRHTRIPLCMAVVVVVLDQPY